MGNIRVSIGDGACCLIPIGILIVVLGIFLLRRQRRFLRASTRTFGTVIDYELTETQERNDDGSISTLRSYAPIIRYTAPDGSPRTFTNRFGTYKKVYDIGTVLPIRYDHSDNEASIDSFVSLYLAQLLILLLGLLLIVLGLLPV